MEMFSETKIVFNSTSALTIIDSKKYEFISGVFPYAYNESL